MLQNKRPICLLDVIYKLIAKVVANRLAQVIGKLIARSQTGFLEGRFIGENIRLVKDIIEYCEMDDKNGMLLALDYKNAFDSVNHNFIIHVLKAFNFGETLIDWVRLLLSGVSVTVMNNGFASRWIPCKRGCLQGVPTSALIFILVIEVLAVRLKENHNIKGINICNIETKISMYADDVTLFLADKSSADEALNTITNFERMSGLKLNLMKSQLMWLGKNKNSSVPIINLVPVRKVKILGVFFSATESCDSENAGTIAKSINNTLGAWQQRSLTIKGRITVTKALIISKLVYAGNSGCIPKKFQVQINSKIMKYLWRGRSPKVAKNVLVSSVGQGGLNAIDVEKFCNSLKMGWIGKMLSDDNPLWKELLQARFGVGISIGRYRQNFHE